MKLVLVYNIVAKTVKEIFAYSIFLESTRSPGILNITYNLNKNPCIVDLFVKISRCMYNLVIIDENVKPNLRKGK